MKANFNIKQEQIEFVKPFFEDKELKEKLGLRDLEKLLQGKGGEFLDDLFEIIDYYTPGDDAEIPEIVYQLEEIHDYVNYCDN
jgi:asparagine synthetase A